VGVVRRRVVILAWWSACLAGARLRCPENKGYLKIPGTRPQTLVYSKRLTSWATGLDR
jgi:hypothetical protein